MDTFPRTIERLRRACPDPFEVHPRTFWDGFEEFFRANGYELWVARPRSEYFPPDNRDRAPDGFFYLHPDDPTNVKRFPTTRPCLCPARTRDGRDVMLRVISIGASGIQHKRALERVSTGNVASVIGNHAIPVLQWLTLNDITFAVFPMLSVFDAAMVYDFQNVGELMETMVQMLEALEFCHSRLVAHRDVFPGNWLSNFGSSKGPDQSAAAVGGVLGRPPKPFRSLFPFKLYLIDFEFAVCFDEDSDPASRLVTGKPITEGDGHQYARPHAPELLGPPDVPHSPFALDIWQLGQYFFELPVLDFTYDTETVIVDMLARDPANRPSAREATESMRKVLRNMSLEELKAPVKSAPAAWRRDLPPPDVA
ncbi:hypothetical protein EXIGLDRAFT_828981 [Exidia glandulosa HHB12029]|uniref:Protein kinase domain-containing protein n=1 Tax=Exidia glandulosa HHB12029 TaxID=1314781 RepID=A0A165PYR5_EXIGL|nr:hypothetical protein EXIGLDRAFT_828981 [Exidia glandulosa HHB12029]